MRLLGKPVHRLSHTVQKECLSLLLAAMPIRRSYKLLSLWNNDSREEVWEYR